MNVSYLEMLVDTKDSIYENAAYSNGDKLDKYLEKITRDEKKVKPFS